MAFKNDKERIAYLEAYRDWDKKSAGPLTDEWQLMIQDNMLGRRWLYVEPAKGVRFVVEQAFRLIEWPKRQRIWTTKNWYIVEGELEPTDEEIYRTPGGCTFEECAASRTMALNRLKELQKEGRL